MIEEVGLIPCPSGMVIAINQHAVKKVVTILTVTRTEVAGRRTKTVTKKSVTVSWCVEALVEENGVQFLKQFTYLFSEEDALKIVPGYTYPILTKANRNHG